MHGKFEASRFKRLMSEERRRELPPEAVLETIGLRRGHIFVDIGAGPGFFSLPAAAIVGPEGRVFGLDVSPIMIDQLRKNAALKRAANIEVGLIAETEPDLPAGADFYFLANVFHEVDDRAAYLKSIRKRMAAGSRLVLIDFLKKKTKHGPPFRNRIPLAAMRALLAASGYAVERVFRPNEDEYGIVARRAAGKRS